MSISLFWWAIIWSTIGYVAFSYRMLAPDEAAAVYFLGRRWKVVGQGLQFVPRLIAKMYRFSIKTHRTLAPGTEEQIVRHDDDPLGPGQVRPIRSIHSSKEAARFYIRPASDGAPWTMVHFNELSEAAKKADEDDELSSSITTEALAYTDWNLKVDATLFDFIETVGSVEEAHRRIVGTMRSALQDLLAPITVRHAVNIKPHLEDLLKTHIEILVGEEKKGPKPTTGVEIERPWGINISASRIEELNTGRTVNQARADKAASIANRVAAVEKAEAEKQQIRLKADAEAYQEVTLGKAKAEAFRAMARVLKTDEGKFAAQLESAKEVLARNGTTVVSGDPAGIIGSLMALVSRATTPAKAAA